MDLLFSGIARAGGPTRAAIRKGDKNGGDRGPQVSHDFSGRQNCRPLRQPITHATLLLLFSNLLKDNCNKKPELLQRRPRDAPNIWVL